MFFVSSTAFLNDLLENPEQIFDTGLFNIELSGGHKPYSRKELGQKITSLLETGVENLLIHNYFPSPEQSFVLNFASNDGQIVRQSLQLLEKALDICAEFSVPYYSFHPGYLNDGIEKQGHFIFDRSRMRPYQKTLESFCNNFEHVYALAEKNKIKLVIENLFVMPDGTRASLNCTLEELEEMLSLIPDSVGILIDLGHLQIASHFLGFDKSDYVAGLLDRYSHRIVEVHLSGNNGAHDEHLPLAADDWQTDAVKLFSDCPGISGTGINVTLESRRLSVAQIIQNKNLINKVLQ